jgi:hypothetical protein
MEKKKVPIRYTSRDFDSIKKDLVDYAKRYYPDTYRDFSEASFGSLMMDTVAYVGDMLSFYLDYEANEGFLETATEYTNVIKQGEQLGYKFRGATSAHGEVEFYIKAPANSTGLGPDNDYLPILLKGTSVSSADGSTFLLTEDLDFADPANVVIVAEQNSSTGLPTYYAIRAKGTVISGELGTERIKVGDFERFKKVRMTAQNVAEVLSVFDSEGHQYYEVEYLSQDVVYRSIPNRGDSSTNAPAAILKPFTVPRRFMMDRTSFTTFLQFGYGSDSETNISSVADPSEVVLKQFGKSYTSDQSFDPSRLLDTDKFGIAPSNTTLTVSFRKNTVGNTNAAANTINSIVNLKMQFKDTSSLNNKKKNAVRSSIECDNEDPIVGNVVNPSLEELKVMIGDNFAAQNRAVTQQDYVALSYAMPSQYGGIRRCSIYRDSDSFRRNLNLYVISEDNNGYLVSTNNTIKQNLKTWLGGNKIINDTVDILDAKVINIQIEYVATAEPGTNKFEILQVANTRLKDKYKMKMDIGESFSFDEVYRVLNQTPGIMDVRDVRLKNVFGKGYSSIGYNIRQNTTPDGRLLTVPKNVIIEVKYLDTDIIGTLM